MMTGFLAVQGIEVHAETQQTTGEAASAVESVELEAEIIENSDVTDADGKAGPEPRAGTRAAGRENRSGRDRKERERRRRKNASPDGNSGSGERTSGKVGRRGERNFGRFRIGEARRIAGGRRYGFRNQRKDVKKQIQKNQRQKSQIRRERILEKWTQKNQIMKIQVQKNPERKI